jgi:hypothetical protein
MSYAAPLRTIMPTKKTSSTRAKSSSSKASLKSMLVAGALGRSSKQQKGAKTSQPAAASSRGTKQQWRRDERG